MFAFLLSIYKDMLISNMAKLSVIVIRDDLKYAVGAVSLE